MAGASGQASVVRESSGGSEAAVGQGGGVQSGSDRAQFLAAPPSRSTARLRSSASRPVVCAAETAQAAESYDERDIRWCTPSWRLR